MSPRGFALPLVGLLGLAVAAREAQALDKQGSAHGGDSAGRSEGVHLSGSASAGISLYNPTYAARPNNSGLALMRYAGHLDVDLVGQRLSLPLDFNMFTDRLQHGPDKLVPTELDFIGGVTSRWPLGPGALELGTRFEHDRQIGSQPSFEQVPPPGKASQSYVDARARYVFSATNARFPRSTASGWLTLGWFAYNPGYFARPDNTGLAFLRYGAHTELAMLDGLVAIGLDAVLFTDRTGSNPLRPTELDLTPELILRRGQFEGHLALETDRPLDRGSYRQTFIYLLGVWSFDLWSKE